MRRRHRPADLAHDRAHGRAARQTLRRLKRVDITLGVVIALLYLGMAALTVLQALRPIP